MCLCVSQILSAGQIIALGIKATGWDILSLRLGSTGKIKTVSLLHLFFSGLKIESLIVTSCKSCYMSLWWAAAATRNRWVIPLLKSNVWPKLGIEPTASHSWGWTPFNSVWKMSTSLEFLFAAWQSWLSVSSKMTSSGLFCLTSVARRTTMVFSALLKKLCGRLACFSLQMQIAVLVFLREMFLIWQFSDKVSL